MSIENMERLAEPVNPNIGDLTPEEVEVIDVYAKRTRGGQWHLAYVEKCPRHTRPFRHYHGGGVGADPYLGDGVWSSHCWPLPGAPRNVGLRLVGIDSELGYPE